MIKYFMRFPLFFLLLLCLSACISPKNAVNENEWGYIDGIRVDKIYTFYDYTTKSYRNAGFVGKDTIWEYERATAFQLTDSCLIYTDNNGQHKF